MELKSAHRLVIARIEKLTGLSLAASTLRNKIISIELPDNESQRFSDVATQVEKICYQYKIAKVEPNGRNAIALILA